MQTLSLNGEWELRRSGEARAFVARVPGSVHADLLAAGRIPDPYYRDNEGDLQWIGESDWVYSRAFEAPADLRTCPRIVLRCEGLDTIAEIRLNGRVAGRADNMFRAWEFDVAPLLRAGTSTIEIRFASALRYVKEKARGQRALPAWGVGQHKVDSGAWIRKQPCNFGWDWGPALVTCGIWRDIELLGVESARLTDMQVRQVHARGRVRLEVACRVERVDRRRLSAWVTVMHDDACVAEATVPVRGGAAKATLEIADPRLWWPNGMGAQPLYEVNVDLVDAAETLVDTETKRIGLRALELRRRPDRWGESFEFAVNGAPFFAKGANWIPGDAILARMSADDYARLLGDAAAAHMNMLRVWGGGIYENEIFYNLCDELGLCVWQDFMFACSTYPTFDDAWMAGVAAEAADNVRRLRHHPCIALWCGNNELEQGLVRKEWSDRSMSWEDYGRLFDRLLPDLVRRLDPDRTYWPCSPHSPHGDREEHWNPACGDAHLWNVWHGGQPLEWYRTSGHRFCSEFGFQSFPEPKTVAGYTLPGDRNVTAPVMEWHQRSRIGNDKIVTYMLAHFRMPRDFEMTLWLSQILQAHFIAYAVEHWRRQMPRTMGALYWQLNDCWPVASWASIDYHGRWKALHHAARRFFAPALVSAVADAKGLVDVFVTSDLAVPFAGRVRWSLTTAAGATIVEDAFAVSAGARSSAKVKRLDVRDVVREVGADDLMVWLRLEHEGATASRALATFAPLKRLDLRNPRIGVQVAADRSGALAVTLAARRPAPWTWMEIDGVDAQFSDNFVHLQPGEPRRLIVQPARPLTAAALRRRLRVRSLYDTYAGAR